MQQSNDLRDFYLDFKEWLDNGAYHKQPFYRDIGLCQNMFIWTKGVGIPLSAPLRHEMNAQFIDEGLNEIYPFNDKGTDYTAECQRCEIHLNPKRIDWINRHAA